MVVGKLVMAPDLATTMLAHNLETADAMTLLETELGYRLDSTHIETSAVLAGEERGRMLDVEPGMPLLRITFVPHDIDNTPLLYAEMDFRPDKFTYEAVIRK
ncbi:UTRA domain-containing protein [Paraburkholderia sacchari]|uniref:UTRA domain-containing protein n=1 Tax=Paraburkholderia sacchari TaxID=159450 RepID=UPI003D95F564